MKGGGRSRKLTYIIDINGNDASYRSAKVRLFNLVTELKVRSQLEMMYEMKPTTRTSRSWAKKKDILTMFGATNALSLYNAAAEEGHWKKLEDTEATISRKRGMLFEHLYREQDGIPPFVKTDAQHSE